jgi:spermidine synthase
LTQQATGRDTAGELIDHADIPGGSHLQLVRHGQDFEILHGGDQLMGSWESRSEKALATLVCPRLKGSSIRILIGGLGMGFTLRAALDILPASATVIVSELVPKVVSWAEGALSHLFGQSLSDPRVALEIRDVHDLIVEQEGCLDAILLDVDNGPDGFTNVANERLYSRWGLRAALAALRPGGILAVWSAYPDDAFCARLEEIGFLVEEITIPIEKDRSDYDHVIWLAVKPR